MICLAREGFVAAGNLVALKPTSAITEKDQEIGAKIKKGYYHGGP